MLAAVDLGTNTVRLLLGSIVQGQLVPVRHERMITRLGGNWTKKEGLAPESMERTLFALKRMGGIIHDSRVTDVRAVGTQALRMSCNGQAFADRVRAETGLALEIISGEEEARLCARGVLEALDPPPGRCLIFDIGGGSTEFVLWNEGAISFSRSYPLGVVSLCEQFADPAAQNMKIRMTLDQLEGDLKASGCFCVGLVEKPCSLVGTAGTATTLAAMDLEMTDYDWRRINNHILKGHRLKEMLAALLPMAVEQRQEMPGLEKGRGDLIIPGLRIVLSVLARFGRDRLRVSDFGLLEGALMSLVDPAK